MAPDNKAGFSPKVNLNIEDHPEEHALLSLCPGLA